MMQRTTVTLEEEVLEALRRRAARERRALSAVLNDLLRRAIRGERNTAPAPRPRWRVFHCGRVFVDPADRDALYSAMEDR